MAAPGYPIVLTADRAMTARYHLLFDGVAAASATAGAPGPVLRFLTPRGRSVDGRAARAPLALRRIEASLLRAGLPVNDVAVVEEAHLASAIGPKTRVVAVFPGEPAGRGMDSSTMVAITGKRIVSRDCFDRLMGRVRELVRERAREARIVLVGPAAQGFSAEDPKAGGFDHIITGHAEANAPDLFEKLTKGDFLPKVIEGKCPAPEDIPSIRGASTMGAVELSRRCGKDCQFCAVARGHMIHLPTRTIIKDVRINVANSQYNLSLVSDDVFRYGSGQTTGHAGESDDGKASGKGAEDGGKEDGGNGLVNPAALIELARSLRSVPDVRLLQIDHASLSSVAQYTDSELATVQRLLTGGPRHRFLWVNVGVETASGALLEQNGSGGKLGNCAPSDWAEFSAVQVERLILAGYFPIVSLMLGLPGETEDDVLRTLDWVNQFRQAKLAVYPVLYTPVNGDRPLDPKDLTTHHWQLIRACYRFNFKWIPRLYRDNQRGGGVPLHRRLLLRLLGCAQSMHWRFRTMWNHWRVEE